LGRNPECSPERRPERRPERNRRMATFKRV